MDENKIKSCSVFCMLPWIHMHMLPTSKVLPCCVWPYDKAVGDVSSEGLLEVWNNDVYKQIRSDMMNGKSNSNCNHCYEVEKAGGYSLRKQANHKFLKKFSDIVSTTSSDGELQNFKMAYFDVRFSNVCNFKCRGCSPELSSSWHNDDKLLYGTHQNKPKYINVLPNEKLWDDLVGLIPTIEEAYFAGGEPLIMEEHYKVLDELIAKNRTDVFLSYNTNLSKLNFKKNHITDYWNKFKKIYVGVSIDDIGPRGEYFRFGMNWEETKTNIHEIKKMSPHVDIGVNCTINIMNVLYVTEIHKTLVQEGLIEPEWFAANLLVDPREYRIQVLPEKFKKIVRTEIKFYMSEYRQLNYPAHVISSLDGVFNSILNYMDAEDLSSLLPQFIERTEKLDSIRNEKFHDTYPELIGLKY